MITLAIIGIVAALTIPQLVANYQKHVASTRVKKAYTELQLAIQRSEVDNGNMADWTYPTKVNVANTRAFVNKYIKPYYLDLSECSTGASNACGAPVSYLGIGYRTKNGTGIAILAGDSVNPSNNDKKAIFVTIDINGSKGPNLLGYDVFNINTNNTKGFLKPSGWSEDVTVSKILSKGVKNMDGDTFYCRKNKSNSSDNLYRHACTLLLYLKNWKMDNEYPW